MKTYPIKFKPILKEKIWGGSKLSNILNKKSNSSQVGESWEISDVEGNISVVENGEYKGLTLKDLMKSFDKQLLGERNFSTFGYNFPLLIKYLDAKTDLSVQVHPDDDMAKSYHNSFGKTEMWYVMDSDKEASIILGLRDKSTHPSVLSAITSDNVEDIFNREKVKQGDSFFIPAGKIHAIGAGVLAAEIQQTSDITYRVYDWDREDDHGNCRDLHTELAIEATKEFDMELKSNYELKSNQPSKLVHNEYFKTNIIDVNHYCKRDYRNLDSFVIFMCVEGKAEIQVDSHKETINLGETILIPASAKLVYLASKNCKLLEISIPQAAEMELRKVS